MLRRGVTLLGLFAGAVVVGVAAAMLVSGHGPTPAPAATGDPPPPARRSVAAHSALYTTGRVTGSSCRAPALHPDDTASMRRFIVAMGDCLDKLWATEFARAGISFAPPARVLWTRPGTGPCGSYPAAGSAAFFCSANDAIYVGLSHIVTASNDAPGWAYSIYASVYAHEYGHHVQDRAGILGYGDRAEGRAATGTARAMVSRRIELQANCFDGVYLGTYAGSLPVSPRQRRIVVRDSHDRGDDGHGSGGHGSRKHYGDWLRRGMGAARPGACNTWLASAGDIS